MLKNIYQTDKGLLEPVRKYGCLFLCYAYASPVLFEGVSGRRSLNRIWCQAIEEGYISGDLNEDGDYDDEREAEVQNPEGLLKLFLIEAKYYGHEAKPSDFPKEKVSFIFGKYVWKGTHFCVIDKSDKILYDPAGHSYTVKNGKLAQRRYYYANKKS